MIVSRAATHASVIMEVVVGLAGQAEADRYLASQAGSSTSLACTDVGTLVDCGDVRSGAGRGAGGVVGEIV